MPVGSAVGGFSLAELMIALVILGVGLLFIAAALPVGLEYTRQSVDMSTAEAAADYAWEQLELYLRTSERLYEHSFSQAPSVPLGTPIRTDCIHRPRKYVRPFGQWPTFPLRNHYEPFFKVRPLVTGNVRFGPIPANASREIVDHVEGTIAAYLSVLTSLLPVDPFEVDVNPSTGLALLQNPALPGVARVYPPIEPVTTFTTADFFNNNPVYPAYDARYKQLATEKLDRERELALDNRVVWTAFYRRVGYDDPGQDIKFGTNDDVLSDPLLYEIIVVITRRPTVSHRFARQDLSTSDIFAFTTPRAYNPVAPPDDDFIAELGFGVGTDRLAPTPWLVVFSYDPNQTPPYDGTPWSDRTISPVAPEPPTLTFRCTPQGGVLLPEGSIFIPAFNCVRYISFRQNPNLDYRLAGFVPHSPESLPIYEVVERPDATTIVVKNNGYYPWLLDPSKPQFWPVWVIPPAFVERGSDGQPVYERTSPIVKIVRRTVRLTEIQ